jgi:hypothetical protein
MLVFTPALETFNSSSFVTDSESPPQQESASRKSSTSTQSTIGTSLLSELAPKTATPGIASDQLERIANECTVAAYQLVWERRDYSTALVVLQQALGFQRLFLGKHHKDVGYTCNFIATTYWLQDDDLNSAMRYFLEARRIFCKLLNKSSDDSKDFQTTGPLLRGIDDRIHCLLIKFRLPESDILRAKQAIDRMIVHELQADLLKEQGWGEAAKKEYRHSRKVAGVLRHLI